MKKMDISRLKSIQLPSESELEDMSARRFEQSLQNPNHITYWFPAVEELNILIPKTEILMISKSISDYALREDYEGAMADPEFVALAEIIESQFDLWGVDQLFLKNSLFSSKHNWENTCKVTRQSKPINHIFANLYDWAICSPEYAIALAVREMIQVEPVFHAFGGTPITKEFRLFAKDGHAYEYQPYWPPGSIREPDVKDWESRLLGISTPSEFELKTMKNTAEAITSKLGGDWSVDFLIGLDGRCYLIDMALAKQSYKSPDVMKID